MRLKAKIIPLLSLLLLASCQSEAESNKPNIPDVDVVANTKLKLNDDVFAKVMKRKGSSSYDSTCADFNRDGVERVLTKTDYAPNKEKDVFTNYVDGDTTQFTSYNGTYTVKVRYLAVDTPESTSEVDEWGKSASNFNKRILKNAKHVLVQSSSSALTGGEAPADLDVYGRSLAYVWYSNEEGTNPSKESFRNLNLELVYAGYSIFSAAASTMDPDFYAAFEQANAIAKAYKKGAYSDEKDPNYYYGDPIKLGLDEIYDESLYESHQDVEGMADGTYSMYADNKTRYTFEGVVSRVIGTSFYIQDKVGDKYYGLYVFSNKSYAPVRVGNRLRVTGVLSFYGGTYELIGISYSDFSINRGKYDMEYVTDENGVNIKEEVKPIDCTPAELASGKYNAVLVRLHDSSKSDNKLYFNTSHNTYNGVTTSYAYGGSEEVNGYNDTYPFYNTDNSMVLFGHFGADGGNMDDFSEITSNSDIIRIKIDRSVSIKNAETGSAVCSYKYYTGEEHVYVQGDAKKAKELTANLESVRNMTEEERLAANIFYVDNTRKAIESPVGIAMNYVSTGGNQKYSLNIASAKDFADFISLD